MSILSYIKDPIPFIAIGGVSGIGKTSIIDCLLNRHSKYFAQPESYTSRERRGENDRYIFASKDEMKSLYQSGDLINLDEVHGNLYGIARNEIEGIKLKNKIPIKEIHPKNFPKFKINGLDTICVLIENKHLSDVSSPFISRENRIEDDFDFERNSNYDIRLNISGLSPDEAARYLIKRIFALRIHLSKHIHPTLIDEINKTGYDKIAKEFTDNLRITTRNFHDASLKFWNPNLKKYFNRKERDNVLELGVGNGWLFQNFINFNHNIYGLEISDCMHSSYCVKTIISSARNIPVKSNFFNLIVGSLIDPMLNPETFLEVERVLIPGGEFLFTIPSLEWAKNLNERINTNQTVFEMLSGEKVPVYSFCDALGTLACLGSFTRLKIVDTFSLNLDKNYSGQISSALINSACKLGKDVFNLPIVIGIKLKKSKNENV